MQFPAALTTFLHALRAGAPWVPALDTFADFPSGYLSADGRVFAIRHQRAPSGRPTHYVALAEPDASEALTLFFAPAGLVAVACSQTLRPKPLPPPEGMIVSTRGDPLSSRFLPPYIRLRKRPTRDLTSVYRSAAAWHRRLGPLDATAAMVVEGRLHMPKDRLTLRPSRRPNHASWERNEAAKLALGPKFATWTWQGIVEMIPPGCPTPLFIEPLGAVDKATDPWHRLILDARPSNKLQGPWGVWYSSVCQLADLFDVCDFMFAEDLEGAYHLSIFAGCTGQLFWSPVFIIDEHGQIVRQWRLVMGCDASSCLGVTLALLWLSASATLALLSTP